MATVGLFILLGQIAPAPLFCTGHQPTESRYYAGKHLHLLRKLGMREYIHDGAF